MKTNPRLQQRLRLFSIAGFLFASIVGAASGMGLTFSLMAAFWACYSAAAWIGIGRQSPSAVSRRIKRTHSS